MAAFRVIVRTDSGSMAAHIGGAVHTELKTFDIDDTDLEAFMRAKIGTYDARQIVGVELLPSKAVMMARAARVCKTCDGRGEIGGFVNAESGYCEATAMSERETWINLIRNEYDPRPNLGKADYPGFEWDDGAGRIADAILADRALLLRKHAEQIERLTQASTLPLDQREP